MSRKTEQEGTLNTVLRVKEREGIDLVLILPISLILPQSYQASRLQSGQQCAQLCLGVLVVLVDGEAEGFFQPRAGFVAASQMKQAFR